MAVIEEQDRYEALRSDTQTVTFSYLDALYKERGRVFDEAEQTLLCFKNEEGFYTNLGLLFSDQCAQFTHIAVFQGTNMAIFRDCREFSGSLLKQLDKSMDYIQQYNRIRSEFVGLVRSDQYDYPPLALREMLLNAYAHRQYSVSAPTLVRLFDDRIECITVGGLTPGLTMEDSILGISVRRNESVTRVFHHVGIAEAYGTGIPRIFVTTQVPTAHSF